MKKINHLSATFEIIFLNASLIENCPTLKQKPNYPCIMWNAPGPYSLINCKTSYRKIAWSLDVTGFGFRLYQSLRNFNGTSRAALPRCLSNWRAIRSLLHPISRLRDFTRSGGKTSHRLVNRGPDRGSMIMNLCKASISIQHGFIVSQSPAAHNNIFLRIVFCYNA